MKKKILFLVFIALFFLTGCTPRFTYEINDGKITEIADIQVDASTKDEEIKDYADYYSLGENNDFKLTINRKDGFANVVAKGKELDLQSYFDRESSYFNKCFERTYFLTDKKEKKISIGTGQFKCLDLDYLEIPEVDVVIKTKHKVYINNADSAKYGTYTWHFDYDNFKNKNITIVLSDSKYVWYYKYMNIFIGIVVIAAVLVVLWLFISFFKGKSNKANRI